MHKRKTKQERHDNKVWRFEYRHPRNKHIIIRQKLRAWEQAETAHLTHKVLHRMATEGNETAKNLLSIMSLFGGYGYLSY